MDLNLNYFTKYLSKFEEKYVFNISLGFWRLLVGMAVLVLVAGLLFLLWGIIPAFRSSAKKANYPPVVTVSLEELQAQVLPRARAEIKKSAQEGQRVSTAEGKPAKEEPPEVAPGEVDYNRLLDSLKALIPPTRYAWKSRGHWEYPYGREYWEYYKSSRYRKWKVDRLGINDRLKTAYRRANADDYMSKKELLTAYLSVLSQFSEDKRTAVLEAVTTYTKESVAQSTANVVLLSGSIPNFSTDRADYLQELATFGKKNPNDGRAFVEYVNGMLNKLDPDVRFDALQAMISSYYKHFNNRIALQKEITNMFLPMVVNFQPEHQVKALGNYYELYLRKNADRMATIRQIDREYARELSLASSEHQSARAKKGEWRLRGVYAIGGAIVFIAFIALILALLSMQRYLERIYERLPTE